MPVVRVTSRRRQTLVFLGGHFGTRRDIVCARRHKSLIVRKRKKFESLKLLNEKLVRSFVVAVYFKLIVFYLSRCEVKRTAVVTMSGVLFQMWMVVLLGTMTEVGRAQVSTAKVMRGNIRRDGKLHLFVLSVGVVAVGLVARVFTAETVSL